MSLNPKQVKKDRNNELIKDYKEKVVTHEWSIVDLVAKYRISSARIYFLLNKYGNN